MPNLKDELVMWCYFARPIVIIPIHIVKVLQYCFILAEEVWKVARYTCAGPTMFKELDDYVDGGVMAQNPSTVGITKIQEFYWQKKLILPISLVVSIGTGILPEDKLGCTDAQDFLSFGKQWFTSEESVGERTGNLVTLLGNAVSLEGNWAWKRSKHSNIVKRRSSPLRGNPASFRLAMV